MQSLMIQHRCMLFTFIMGIPSSETIPKPKNTLSATNEKAGQDVEKRHRDPARIRAWVLWIPVRWHGLTNWATVALALSILSTPFRPRCNAKSPTVHDMHVSAISGLHACAAIFLPALDLTAFTQSGYYAFHAHARTPTHSFRETYARVLQDSRDTSVVR